MSKIVSDKNTVHIALATYPQNQASEYVKDIENYYKGFKGRLSGNFVESATFHENLYKPLIYHIFGNYDVAFVSIVDSYKFGQKIFLPKVDDLSDKSINGYNPNSYQILTGICLKEKRGKSLISLYNSVKRKKFIGIINLKLNNGLHIGNGQELINPLCSKISTLIKSNKTSEFIINQSFSWFELTVLLFDNNFDIITKTISDLRGLTLGDLNLPDNSVADNSLIKLLHVSKKDINKCHIFIDTNSYFGLSYDQFTTGKLNNIKSLKTQIEFQVKPGHYVQVYNELTRLGLRANRELTREKKIVENDILINQNETKFLIGKNDFLIKFKSDKLENNYRLFKCIRDYNTGIGKYIRRIKTTVLTENFEKECDSSDLIQWSEKLKGLSYSHIALEEIERFLLELKVSRQIREKVIKILFNYNSGILDRVMFTYFLDFTVFIRNFLQAIVSDYLQFKYCLLSPGDRDKKYKRLINKLFKKLTKTPCGWKAFLVSEIKSFNKQKEFYFKDGYHFKDIDYLESKYKVIISAFEEGYHLRLLNGYVFEEMYDLDVDFNSSIQQLLTSYNTIVADMANFYYENPYLSGMLVQLNLQNTVSNDFSINYNAYHLTAPEFVFFTLEKEILNPLLSNSETLIKLDILKVEVLLEILKGLNNKHLMEYYDEEIIDIRYLFIDYSRYTLSCNGDRDLFIYWFWTYNFQNSSLYNSLGKFREKYFKTELFRLLLVIGLENKEDMDKLECPIPELYHYWNRYFCEFKELAKLLLSKLEENDFIIKVLDIINKEKVTSGSDRNLKEGVMEIIDSMSQHIRDKGEFKYMSFIITKKHFLKEVYEKYFKKYNNPHASFSNSDTEMLKFLREKHALLYHGIIYSFLKLIYEKNEGKVRLLRRNWADGKPIKKFLINDENKRFLFYTEQLGGTFHTNSTRLNEYFTLENSLIQTIFHLGAIKKKELMKHFLQL